MFEKLAKWSVLISKKFEKDEFYLNPSALGLWLVFVPIGTPKMLNGSYGCWTHVWVPVHFGLLFWGFFSQDLHLDTFLIHVLKIKPFFFFFPDNSGIFSNDYLLDKYSKNSWLSTILLLSGYPFYSHASKPIFYTN